MKSTRLALERIRSIIARVAPSLPRVLLHPAIALILGAPIVAHAIMGEDAQNLGLVLAPQKGEVLLACAFGGACKTNGSFFRNLAASQIKSAGTLESGITIPAVPPGTGGLGFGSLLSTNASSHPTDIFCWTGVSSGVGERQCIRLESGSGSAVNGAIVDTSSNNAECNSAAAFFGQPPNTFNYLVKFDEDLYGEENAVQVVTCTNVKATALSYANIAQTAVSVSANRGMAAYDLKLFGGLYCCK